MSKNIKGVTGDFQLTWKNGKPTLTSIRTNTPPRRTQMDDESGTPTNTPRIVQTYNGTYRVEPGDE